MSTSRLHMTGTFLGTGEDLEVKYEKVGFKPSRVKLLNVSGDCSAEWIENMADDSMQKTVDSGAGTTDVSLVTTKGITPLNTGFGLGADTDLNVLGQIVHFECWG